MKHPKVEQSVSLQGPPILRRVMDTIQTEFACCGAGGCGDYSWTGLPISQPESCDEGCEGCAEPVEKVRKQF